MVLGHQTATDDVNDDVSLTNVDEHIVLQHDGLLLPDENTVANSKVFDQIGALVRLKLNLEVASTMLLCCLFVFVWDDEVVDHTFLDIK